MALRTRFIPHSVQIKTNTGSVDIWINQIISANPDLGVSLFEESSGSETDREFVAAKDIQSVMPFVTTDLSVLGTVGMIGLLIDSGSSKPGLLAYGRELPFGALPTAIATANHLKMAVSDGLLVPQSVQASHNQAARLSLMLHAALGIDGTSGASPMIFSAGNAINSGAGATVKLYTAGVVKYNSRLVKGIMDISVSFGLQVLKESDSGDVFPTHLSIIARDPKIEFTTRDAALIAEVGEGVSVSSGFGVYFRGVTQNGQRIANASGSHLGITGVAGMITPGALSLQHKQADAVPFTITPSKNSTLLTISTTAAIPDS